MSLFNEMEALAPNPEEWGLRGLFHIGRRHSRIESGTSGIANVPKRVYPQLVDSKWNPTLLKGRMNLVGDLQGDRRGRTPNDDLQILAREGEGACASVCAGRSHLPLRGKLGWMTPRPGPKKTGK